MDLTSYRMESSRDIVRLVLSAIDKPGLSDLKDEGPPCRHTGTFVGLGASRTGPGRLGRRDEPNSSTNVTPLAQAAGRRDEQVAASISRLQFGISEPTKSALDAKTASSASHFQASGKLLHHAQTTTSTRPRCELSFVATFQPPSRP